MDQRVRPVRGGGRVVELQSPRDVQIIERPVPFVGDAEVRVDVDAVGVCGTDLHAYRGRASRYPLIPGHDLVGRVAAIGRNVPNDLMGQRVVVDPTLSCGTCTYCTNDRRGLCPQSRYLGMSCDGGMAEHLVVPSTAVHRVPDSVDDPTATLLEPVVVTLRLLDRATTLLPTAAPVRIIGAGPLGIVMALVLDQLGYVPELLEQDEHRRDRARGMSLRCARPSEPPEAPGSPCLVVDTSAAEPGTQLALELATPGSLIALIGRSPTDIPASRILLDELAVLGIRGGADRYPDALRWLDRARMSLGCVVSHEFRVEEASTAFRQADDASQHVLRSTLVWR